MKRADATLAFIAGVVFAVGLTVSGMTAPAKVIAFLDVAGDWDPSLAFVMAGAIGVHALALRLTRGRPAQRPARGPVDVRLVAGSVIFGIGWGLAGYCPGPAIVSLATFRSAPVVFCLAMAAGTAAVRLSPATFGFARFAWRRSRQTTAS